MGIESMLVDKKVEVKEESTNRKRRDDEIKICLKNCINRNNFSD